MTMSAFHRPFRANAPRAIRSRSRRGFIIGWVSILFLGAAGYAAASTLISPSHGHLHLAQIGQDHYPVLTKS